MVRVSIVSALACVIDCSGGTPESNSPPRLTDVYKLSVTSPAGCVCLIRLNNEPVLHVCAPGGMLADVTAFVVDGTNILRLTVTATPCNGEVTASVDRVRYETGERVEVAKLARSVTVDSALPVDDNCEFRAALSFRWTWQSAQVIDSIAPSDEEAIRGEIQKLARLIEAGNLEAVLAFRAGWLPSEVLLPRELADPKQVISSREQKWLRSVNRVETANAGSLRFYPGTKLVLVEGEDAPFSNSNAATAFVLRAQTQPSSSGVQTKGLVLGERALHCMRENGTWRIMLGNWVTSSPEVEAAK